MARLLLTVGVLGLAACGGSDGDPGPAGASGSSCHVTDNGNGTATISCDDGTEATVENGDTGPRGADGADGSNGADGATGAAGPAGATGPMGATGAAGPEATATRVSESFFCAAGLESTALSFTYNAVLLSSGDLFVHGSVRGSLSESSATRLYSPAQAGYQTAQVEFRFDVDGTADGGWFSLTLDRGTLVTVIQYRQTDPGAITDIWTMLPTACVHNFY